MLIILGPAAASTADREVAAATLGLAERCAAVPLQVCRVEAIDCR
jgi:hypothetical protein